MLCVVSAAVLSGQACATLEELRRRRASGSDITFAESDRDRIGQRYQQLVHFLGKGLPKIIARSAHRYHDQPAADPSS